MSGMDCGLAENPFARLDREENLWSFLSSRREEPYSNPNKTLLVPGYVPGGTQEVAQIT